ncbi:MAG TPA: ATP-binding protein [Candidatus Megaira endosymbiont of Nemacystus decipiens]|nr:ATP-binding protein [Candidatus Megaera endosymbiont of Nemacystus decipiens]
MILRQLKSQIKQKISTNHILILYGARRVGKTTLMREIFSELKGKKLFLNAEKFSDRDILTTQNFSQLKASFAHLDYLMIDEAQTIMNIGQILKLMHDEFNDLNIVVSGSASFDLTNKLGEPLTGRKKTLTLYPIAVLEQAKHEAQFKDNLHNYLLYGSYPQIIKASSFEDKKEALAELSSSYLYKDILEMTDIKNSGKIRDLLILLALQLGSEVSLNELAKNLQLHIVTVQKYLDLLEKSFVIFKLRSFSRNLRKEINKSSKYYFYDTGIRNAILGNFRPLNLRNDVGGLWENFLICEKIKQNEYNRKFINQYFWRTYDRQEIDYIEEENGYLNAYEFKWNPKTKAKKPKLFLDSYQDSTFQIISQDNYISDFINYL